MIYCVVPRELEGELFETLKAHYAGNPNVAVIVDRRRAERRYRTATPAEREQRILRDRRRRHVAGEFAPLFGEVSADAAA
jgi:hypothetical protein